VWRPELVSRLSTADVAQVAALAGDARFLYESYGTPEALLDEGLAFGVYRQERLVSMAASLALTPKHCSAGVYTHRRYRNRGYATDCVEALFAHVLSRGILPLWRIGVRQKVAIYFAEKLEMDEIGTDGQEVYLQVSG
jgi:predicted GNAT family acetyltransferase